MTISEEKSSKKTSLKIPTKKAKEKDAAPSFNDIRNEQERVLQAAIEKKFGKGFIGTASDIKHKAVRRISSGVFSLDVALGGGWPMGRMNLIWGPKSSSKTYLMLKLIKEAQRLDLMTNRFISELPDDVEAVPLKVAYLDLEGAMDFVWAGQNVGVDLTRLTYGRPESAEQGAQLVESCIMSGVYNVVVVDSLAAMTPEDEMAGDSGDFNVGLAARINNQFFRKMQSAMNKIYNNDPRLVPTVFIINQERFKVGKAASYGDPRTKTGGAGQEFYSSVEVQMHAGSIVYEKPEKMKGESEGEKEPKYQTKPKVAKFDYKILKNKVSPPKIEGGFWVAVDDDEDKNVVKGQTIERATIMMYAENLGLLKKINDTTWTFKGQTFKRKSELVAKIFDDEWECTLLKREMLRMLFPESFSYEKDSETKSLRESFIGIQTEEGSNGIDLSDAI